MWIFRVFFSLLKVLEDPERMWSKQFNHNFYDSFSVFISVWASLSRLSSLLPSCYPRDAARVHRQGETWNGFLINIFSCLNLERRAGFSFNDLIWLIVSLNCFRRKILYTIFLFPIVCPISYAYKKNREVESRYRAQNMSFSLIISRGRTGMKSSLP